MKITDWWEKLKTGNRGFSLLELLIAIGISSIILIVVITIIVQVFKRSQGSWESYKANNQAQAVCERITKEVRQATEIVSAGNQGLTIREYVVATDPAPCQVRFYLDGTSLMRGEIPPTGSEAPYTYNPASETTKILAFDVINGAERIFSYYNQDGETLSAPINPLEVTLIKMKFIFKQLDNPSPFKVETSAQLRWNKTNL